jgi:putative membrane protein
MDIRLCIMTAWIAGAASILGCSDNRVPAAEANASDGRENESTSASASTSPNGSETQRLSDAQIASVTSAANTGEVAQARAALPKLTKPEAKQFATMMTEMHTTAEDRQAALAREKGLTPEANPVSAKLTQESNAIVEQLAAADPDTIDRLYLEKQVSVHQKVLETIDNVLLPSASDPALKQELQTSRAEVAMHLERARDALSKLD